MDSIGVKVAPYVLSETSNVLSIRQRCMDESSSGGRLQTNLSLGKIVFNPLRPMLTFSGQTFRVRDVVFDVMKTFLPLEDSRYGLDQRNSSEELAKSL